MKGYYDEIIQIIFFQLSCQKEISDDFFEVFKLLQFSFFCFGLLKLVSIHLLESLSLSYTSA